MNKLTKALLASAVCMVPYNALATESINITVASSHPLAVPWVGFIKSHFMAKTDEILAGTGNYEIDWQEAFGGQLYKINATLTSVEQGITDIGWVFSMLEPAKLPLSQASSYAPFATANPPAQLALTWDLMQSNDEFRKEWEQYNIKVLGLTGTDSYDVYTAEPVNTFADLDGIKLSAPGVLGNWLRGTGANAVDGALTTYYTDIQTGVSEGTLSLALGILPTKTYEVAPYISRFDIGTAFSGAVAINKDTWDGLPEEVQNAMVEAGAYYTESHANDLVERHEAAIDKMVEVGAGQSTPVTVIKIPDAEREAWVNNLPDIATEWVEELEGRGVGARAFMKAYMEGLRDRGEAPVRNWDENL
ncbi:C4-dicarboxylate TRAP transporter substrate-binding protein [Acuticoccus sp. MNP-M23]|uniref:C4-dicarboxylate TRAP transporter substrate-binding protein n=1 Tax=Acuticoccus sp. MNP-M23 TaxID=3072793 RepID=UPI00281582A7|nr:C4-dicarboxylate TRAP transporter substrate-binding protein [Acuticoccus sp. MNP-M23]WMS44579.1 C4-dicarboxylate TRAP transporter substrate-binding protein [Acuticoccus sp. MNP-M23]